MSAIIKSTFQITLALLLASGALADTVVWRKLPITLDLVVGVEQMIVLPSDGAVGLPATLANDNVFRALSNNGTVYWKALEPFGETRIQVLLDSGEYLLFDVTARVERAPPAAVDTLQVVLPSIEGSHATPIAQGEGEPVSFFELIRYAAQSVYSPKRLITPLAGIRPVPVGLKGPLNHLYDLGAHRGLIVQPYKAWSVQGLYVTALVVTNTHSHPLALDHRKVTHAAQAQRSGVAPHFIASAFFNTALSARGEPGNRTTLFIVTDQPIRQVVRGGVHGS